MSYQSLQSSNHKTFRSVRSQQPPAGDEDDQQYGEKSQSPILDSAARSGTANKNELHWKVVAVCSESEAISITWCWD